MKSYNICLSVFGLFHLVCCPTGSSTLLQMAGFPLWLNRIPCVYMCVCVCVCFLFSFPSFFLFGYTVWPVRSYFPVQGLNPCPLQWRHGLPTTGSPRKAIYHVFFIHSPTDECLGCFHISATLSNAAASMLEQVFLQETDFISFGYTQKWDCWIIW